MSENGEHPGDARPAYAAVDAAPGYPRGVTSLSRVLIVVDPQKAFADPAWGPRDNPAAEANIVRLLDAWRAAQLPVVLVRHDSVHPDSPLAPGAAGHAFHDGVDGPHDLLVTKHVNSAFYGEPDLHAWLQARGATAVTICGITTDHCCSTTARMAGNLGYDVDFVLDATHCHDRALPDGTVIPAEQVARAAAASLHGEFATVVTTEQALAGVASDRA
ncbi:MAG: cysteine hydrolase family protein [Microcella sp.]|nr:cysteine hydrolase family protein [Microcella sp.]